MRQGHRAARMLVQVSTVDKYQGQQNDYVLLSLVRTRVVGHFRDVRRLVGVAWMGAVRVAVYVVDCKVESVQAWQLAAYIKDVQLPSDF